MIATNADNLIKKRMSSSTEFILVYGQLRVGGIETLIVRLANHLVSNGFVVSVFCVEGGQLELLLDKTIFILKYNSIKDLVCKVRKNVGYGKCDTTILLSFDPISAARALKIEGELSSGISKVIHISGIFHPRAYFMTEERIDRIILNYIIARAIGEEHLFFMNEECRVAHSVKWHTDLSCCPILALPINYIKPCWEPSSNEKLRIISVGRLVNFKAYNLAAASIVRACRDSGIHVIWDIFGDGPLYHTIEAEIKAMGVVNEVHLMGRLDYNDFQDKVSSYDLFIGMGTSALEAAMLGVPTVCATIDEATRCYGYLHNLPYGNVGELQSTPPNIDLIDLIINYSATTQAQRLHLSKQCRAIAEKYGTPKFIESILTIANTQLASPSMFLKRLASELYRFATESSFVIAVRRLVYQRRA